MAEKEIKTDNGNSIGMKSCLSDGVPPMNERSLNEVESIGMKSCSSGGVPTRPPIQESEPAAFNAKSSVKTKGIIRMYDISQYPWDRAQILVKFILAKKHEEISREIELNEVIQHGCCTPKQFNTLDDNDETIQGYTVTIEFESFCKIWIQPTESRLRITPSQPQIFTKEDLLGNSRLAECSVNYIVEDEEMVFKCTHGELLKLHIETDEKQKIVKKFNLYINKNVHPNTEVYNCTMPLRDRQLLQQNHIFILDNVSDSFELSRKLFSEGILSCNDLEDLDAVKERRKKIDKLLQIIPRRGNILKTFIKVLNDINPRVATHLLVTS
ncbi:predicted protein [Nematostella vectensis]|uniref:CARD domain-containing protein n=1 Tax=Nematostella vectensis TaxID=45351 RepID=A7RRZ6_NEMVE|nr:predicted protein [Nematostella vectensis]|eukprot:XP_001637725.1 predicted protein [Nematostella vectensis]